MKRTTVDDLHKEWMESPSYQREYKALEAEFSLTGALIEARSRAGLTQEQVAQRMKTTQAVVARLEGGAACPRRGRLKNTLRRRVAACGSALSRKRRGLKGGQRVRR